jgi:hypothetical protein
LKVIKQENKIKASDAKAIPEAKEWYLKGISPMVACNSKYECLSKSHVFFLALMLQSM